MHMHNFIFHHFKVTNILCICALFCFYFSIVTVDEGGNVLTKTIPTELGLLTSLSHLNLGEIVI